MTGDPYVLRNLRTPPTPLIEALARNRRELTTRWRAITAVAFTVGVAIGWRAAR